MDKKEKEKIIKEIKKIKLNELLEIKKIAWEEYKKCNKKFFEKIFLNKNSE